MKVEYVFTSDQLSAIDDCPNCQSLMSAPYSLPTQFSIRRPDGTIVPLCEEHWPTLSATDLSPGTSQPSPNRPSSTDESARSSQQARPDASSTAPDPTDSGPTGRLP